MSILYSVQMHKPRKTCWERSRRATIQMYIFHFEPNKLEMKFGVKFIYSEFVFDVVGIDYNYFQI